LRLYPRRDQDASVRAEALAGNESRIKELRARLCDLLKHSQGRNSFQVG
jgi:hypothetical protein